MNELWQKLLGPIINMLRTVIRYVLTGPREPGDGPRV